MNSVMPVLLVLAAPLVSFAQSPSEDDEGHLILPGEVADLVRRDSTIVFLDVRTPEEFHGETGHLSGALLIPIQDLEKRIGELEPYRNRKIIVYCRTGHRSTRGTELLLERGFDALNLKGGITRWRAEKFPTVGNGR